jgi:hypothetical protein
MRAKRAAINFMGGGMPVCPKSCKNVTSSLPVGQNLRYVLRATMTPLAVNILACQYRIYTKPPAMALPLPKEACPLQKCL